MIVSKTPLRVSFAGGGSDMPDFYEAHGGAVVSTAIDKWIRVIVSRRFEGDIRVAYSRTETVETADRVEHELVREALRVTGLPRGLDIVTLADVPSRGTGLGSSSAVTVGLLSALYAFQGIQRSAAALAEQACEIEIDVLRKPIGRQDQYAVAFGGFNLIEFLPAGAGVRVRPIVAPLQTLERLHSCLMLFYTGRQRSAADVLSDQRDAARDGSATATLSAMRDLAYELRDALGEGDIDAFGSILHRNWELKRTLAGGVSDDELDALYARAMDAGAGAEQLAAAGRGGFLLFHALPERHAAVRAALSDLRETPFRFAANGSHIQLFEDSR